MKKMTILCFLDLFYSSLIIINLKTAKKPIAFHPNCRLKKHAHYIKDCKKVPTTFSIFKLFEMQFIFIFCKKFTIHYPNFKDFRFYIFIIATINAVIPGLCLLLT